MRRGLGCGGLGFGLGGFCRRVGEILEADAVELAAGDALVEAGDFGAELAAGGKAVGAGVGRRQRTQRRQRIDGGDQEARGRKAGDVGALADLDARAVPQAEGLGLAAAADEVEEAGLEEEHGEMVSRGVGVSKRECRRVARLFHHRATENTETHRDGRGKKRRGQEGNRDARVKETQQKATEFRGHRGGGGHGAQN
jgi:hypothetical protein